MNRCFALLVAPTAISCSMAILLITTLFHATARSTTVVQSVCLTAFLYHVPLRCQYSEPWKELPCAQTDIAPSITIGALRGCHACRADLLGTIECRCSDRFICGHFLAHLVGQSEARHCQS